MAAKASRQSFGEAIARIGETNPNVMVMDADLGKSTMTGAFAKKFPDRYLEFGIAEHNMIGTAAGLSLAGKIPFAASFACFLTGRYETIRISACYSNANVKLVGTHAGIGIGEDGNSQMGLEDIAVLRSLPNFVILQPGDDIETQKAVEWSAQHMGSVYLRLTRQKLPDVHGTDYQFNMGKGDVLKNSANTELAIFATGGVLYNALQAAQELEKEGLSATVVNFHTIKPIDEALIKEMASRHKQILTIEDHNIIGGLGSAVSEVLSELGLPVRLTRHGVSAFGESGDPEGLYEKYGFSTPKIKTLVKQLVK